MANNDDPVEVLRQCRVEFGANLEQKYSLIATAYAMALRLHQDPDTRKRFFEEDYFRHTRTWEIRSKRDLFREVCKYVLNARTINEKKRASKYGKVLWHLDSKNIAAEDAASTIRIFDGIDAIARHGVPDPVILDPRDVGDGMTGTGEVIDYGGGAEDDPGEDDNSDDEEADVSDGASDDAHPAHQEPGEDKPEDDGSAVRKAAVLMRLTGDERRLQKLLSTPLGRDVKVRFTPVEMNGAELIVEVRSVVQPKPTNWSTIRVLASGDEQYYSPDQCEYREEHSG